MKKYLSIISLFIITNHMLIAQCNDRYQADLFSSVNVTTTNYSDVYSDNFHKMDIYSGDGENFKWKAWYEPYARDWYWKGPEIGTERGEEFKTSFTLDSGIYYIKVFSGNNIEHYSLVVGEAEFFGSNLWEQILTWTPIIFYIGPYMDIVH